MKKIEVSELQNYKNKTAELSNVSAITVSLIESSIKDLKKTNEDMMLQKEAIENYIQELQNENNTLENLIADNAAIIAGLEKAIKECETNDI